MPFKSEKFWSVITARTDLSSRTAVAAFALIFGAAVAPSAWATVTATFQPSAGSSTQINPGGSNGTSFFIAGANQDSPARGQPPVLKGCAPAGDGAGNSTCNTFFDSDNGFHPFDLYATQDTDISGNPNIIWFQLTSTLTSTTATSQYVVVAQAVPGTGGSTSTNFFVPIAGVAGSSCTAGGNCYNLGNTSNIYYNSGGFIYYETPFSPGNTITVGIYPAQICWAGASTNPTGSQQTATPAGCFPAPQDINGLAASGGLGYGVQPSIGSNNPTQAPLQIHFDIWAVSATATGGNVYGTALTGSAADAGTTYSVYFQSDTPTMVASDNCTNVDNYTPGDGEISVLTSAFSLDEFSVSTGANGQVGQTGVQDISHAPPSALGIASVKGINAAFPTIASESDLNNNNALNFASPPFITINGELPIPGFQNVSSNQSASGPTDPNTYQLQFMVRDASGMVAVPQSGGCQLKNVQTAPIQGFLGQTQCFIATGTFRSATAAPIQLLRHFRDQVLLHSSAGTSFVHWYYHWSPSAARWLIDHPMFRFPVFLALAPLEVLAWLALHAAWLMIPLLGAVGLIGFGILSRAGFRSKTDEREAGR